MSNETKQLEFINNNITDIINLALENESKIGFVKIYSDNNYKPYGLKFIESEFNKDDYTYFNSENKILRITEVEDHKESVFVYFEILWSDTQTKWLVKKLINIRELKSQK